MNRELALLNSLAWYDAILGAHGIDGSPTEHHWSTDAAVPLYYSNFITRTGTAGFAAQWRRLEELAAHPPKPVWSLKDSYALLDSERLERLGLRLLFEARWYGLTAKDGDAFESETGARFVSARLPEQLAQWEAAWQVSSPAPGRVFPDAVLADPNLTFLCADGLGGCALNLSPDAVGLSNVFLANGVAAAPFLRDCVREAHRRYPARAVVGYGPAAQLESIAVLDRLADSIDLGPLRVWLVAQLDDAL